MPYRTIIEPFKIHSVQAIAFPSPEEREAALRRLSHGAKSLLAAAQAAASEVKP